MPRRTLITLLVAVIAAAGLTIWAASASGMPFATLGLAALLATAAVHFLMTRR